jgi:hypothetical protein
MAEKYLKDGIMPQKPIHPSNTCDPLTGNRTENLLPIENYKKYFEANGYSFDVYAGFYNTNYSQKVFNLITPSLNKLISKSSTNSISLAPFIGLYGTKGKI